MRAPKPAVVFDGYYGMRNVGDDAFCLVAYDVAVDRWGCRDIAYLSRQAHLPTLPDAARGLEPESPRIRGQVRVSVLASMLRSRRVVHVGGSTLMRPLKRHRDQARLAALGLLQLHAVGVSVGPFEDSEAALGVRHILSRFRSISVRDSASLERLIELDPHVAPRLGFDVAVLLDAPPEPDESSGASGVSGRPIVGVTVCAHEAARGQDAQRERRRFERTLEALRLATHELDASVRVLVFNDHPRWGDLGLSSELVARLGKDAHIVPRPSDPRQMLNHIAACDVVVATRLHSALFAYRSGVPFLIIAYQRKGVDLAATMRLPGSFVFEPDGPSPDAAAHAICQLVEDGSPADLMPLAEARRLAIESFPSAL